MRIVVCSQFFLDSALWKTLSERVLPRLLERRGSLRVWSAGCYTGKEPYSMAILLDELTPGRRHAILATDRDAAALQIALAGGPYTRQDVSNLTPEQRAKYIMPAVPPFFVSDELRSRVEFQIHDLRVDAYGRDFDVIGYRNLEPFFSAEENRQIYRKFHAALRPGGVVFTGAVERIPCAEKMGFRRAADALYEKVAHSAGGA